MPNKDIQSYINSLSESKSKDVQLLHETISAKWPKIQLWFFDGKNSEGKVVSNPNIGYDTYTIHYADGSSKDFYKVGISANTGGISVYIMGLEDKTHLAKRYGETIGKASITSYCIKFKQLKDIQLEVLMAAIEERILLNSNSK